MTLEELKRTNRLLKEALHLEQEHLQAAQQRIKRLEEAGDDLHDGWRGNRENKDKYLWAWRKAKEAKP